MHRSLLVLALVSTSACGLTGGGDAWSIDKNLACEADVVGLARDLTTHLVNGGDGTGAFDYDPGGAQLTNHSGVYDPVTGDFSWTSTGSGESWIDTIEVTDAYGYANENGDLDVVGTRTVTDVLGVEDSRAFRIERTGCESEVRTRYTTDALVEREQVETGTFTADAYTYTRVIDVEGSPYTFEGSRLVDGTYAHDIEYDASGYSYSGDEVGDLDDGTSTTDYREEFTTQNGVTVRVGTDSRGTDGSRTRSYEQTTSNGSTQWDYTLDYEGNGSGTVTGSGLDCTLTFTAGSCRYDCGRAGRGNC